LFAYQSKSDFGKSVHPISGGTSWCDGFCNDAGNVPDPQVKIHLKIDVSHCAGQVYLTFGTRCNDQISFSPFGLQKTFHLHLFAVTVAVQPGGVATAPGTRA
jgi:hypothetical protein